MQREITQKQKLLGEDGNIINSGYAKSLIWDYNREAITAPRALIKEWDYYYIGNDKIGLAITMSDMGYIGAMSASVIDFENVCEITKSSVILFPFGKTNMPITSKFGDVSCKNGGVKMTFNNDGTSRHLFGEYKKFGNNKETLSFDIILYDEPQENMVIATPFKKRGRFYYNQKINCMKVKGSFSLGDKVFELNEENNAQGLLDWGRGCWTYDNTWYWSSASTTLENGNSFGFNLGYGFGDNKFATENMIFYKGLAHKIDEVTFNIPQKDGKEDYLSEWSFTSNDGRIEMTFTPIIDRYAPFNLGLFCMIPHQVFGKFNGTAILDNGEVVKINNVLGFAEKVHNKW